MHWIDPEHLPSTDGEMERFVVNPRGEIDGLVLHGGTLVHVPPHLSAKIRATFDCGDAVRVRGVRPRGTDMVAAVSLTATADGRTIDDHGPDAEKDDRADDPVNPARMTVSGTVRLLLHGPKGELRGALLDDGTALRIGRKEAVAFADLLRPGAVLAASGDGVETADGRSVAVREIGPANGTLSPVNSRKHTPRDDGASDRAA